MVVTDSLITDLGTRIKKDKQNKTIHKLKISRIKEKIRNKKMMTIMIHQWKPKERILIQWYCLLKKINNLWNFNDQFKCATNKY